MAPQAALTSRQPPLLNGYHHRCCNALLCIILLMRLTICQTAGMWHTYAGAIDGVHAVATLLQHH